MTECVETSSKKLFSDAVSFSANTSYQSG